MKKLLITLLLIPCFCFSQNKMWGTGGFNTNSNLWYLINTSDSLQSQRTDSLVLFKPVRSANIIVPNLYGTSVSSGSLILNSTSNATKGNIVFGATTKAYYDENAQTFLGYNSSPQLRFRFGSTSAGQSISTRDGQLSIGIIDDAQNSALRLFNATSGLSYIDGYSEGAGKSSNYDIIIGARVNNTGTAITNSTTAETGSNVQIGFQTATIPSSVLSLNTTTRGFLLPRLTNTQMNAISSPAVGLKIFNTTDSSTYDYRGTTSGWQKSLYSANSGVSNYLHTIFTPTTGGTVSLTNNYYNIINPAGALLALTINLPSTPSNNDVVYIKFTQTITTVTYANGTVVDGITGPAAGGLVVLTYDSGTTSWY